MSLKEWWAQGFPGGWLVRNLPSKAEYVGLISVRGTEIPHAAGQLSRPAATREAHVPQWRPRATKIKKKKRWVHTKCSSEGKSAYWCGRCYLLPSEHFLFFPARKMVWLCLRNSSESLDLKNVKLLSCVHAQWCLTLCDLMDCSSSGSPNHGVPQARILEYHTVSSSRESSRPRGWSCVSCIGRQILYPEPPGKPQFLGRFSFLLIKSGWKTSVFLWCYFLCGYVYVFWCLFVTMCWKTWASLVAQWWKIHLPVQEIWDLSLSQKDPLKRGMVTHSNILAWKIPWMKELMVYSPWGHKELDIIE